jgi:hydroxymethylglutaryl-CoA reductase (NADPH)
MTDTSRPNDVRARIPRRKDDDHSHDAAEERRAFLKARSGASLDHVGRATIDPALTAGNIENYIGAAQIPIGVAGPLRVRGEHIEDEDVYVPLATTEGTLVASYNRGMRILTEAGGVKTTIVERYMQRAPVFHFDDARGAKAFKAWLEANMDGVRAAAEASSSVVKLSHAETYAVGPMLHVRFNFETGDAAGQNMAGKAGLAACQWIAPTIPAARATPCPGPWTRTKSTPSSTCCTHAARGWWRKRASRCAAARAGGRRGGGPVPGAAQFLRGLGDGGLGQ